MILCGVRRCERRNGGAGLADAAGSWPQQGENPHGNRVSAASGSVLCKKVRPRLENGSNEQTGLFVGGLRRVRIDSAATSSLRFDAALAAANVLLFLAIVVTPRVLLLGPLLLAVVITVLVLGFLLSRLVATALAVFAGLAFR